MTVRYLRHADLRLTGLEGEGVALHLGTRKYYSLSESGLDLLEALVTPRTLEELSAVLTARYDVTPEQARDSARAFVEHGCSVGMLVTEESS